MLPSSDTVAGSYCNVQCIHHNTVLLTAALHPRHKTVLRLTSAHQRLPCLASLCRHHLSANFKGAAQQPSKGLAEPPPAALADVRRLRMPKACTAARCLPHTRLTSRHHLLP
jgi:hypothetical protein